MRVVGKTYTILALLAQGPRTSRELSDMGLSAGINRLVKAGLVEREHLPALLYKGLYLYRITEEGRRVLECLDRLKQASGLVVVLRWGEE